MKQLKTGWILFILSIKLLTILIAGIAIYISIGNLRSIDKSISILEEAAKPKLSDGHHATLYGSYDEIYWFKIGTVPIKNNLHAPYKVVTTEDVLLAVNE